MASQLRDSPLYQEQMAELASNAVNATNNSNNCATLAATLNNALKAWRANPPADFVCICPLRGKIVLKYTPQKKADLELQVQTYMRMQCIYRLENTFYTSMQSNLDDLPGYQRLLIAAASVEHPMCLASDLHLHQSITKACADLELFIEANCSAFDDTGILFLVVNSDTDKAKDAEKSTYSSCSLFLRHLRQVHKQANEYRRGMLMT